MKHRVRLDIILFCAGLIGLFFLLGILFGEIYSVPTKLDSIPTIRQLQTDLKELGLYKGEIDGKPGPLMITAWKAAINDKYGIESCEDMK